MKEIDVTTPTGITIVAGMLLDQREDSDPNNWPYRHDIIYPPTNRPDIWAQICKQAYEKCDEKKQPILKIWLLIEQVNGLRRQSDLWDINLAMELLEEAKQKIDKLPEDHPRKSRLKEMFFYHAGYVYYPAGEFKKAALCHSMEAEIARRDGNKKGELLAEFNTEFMLLNAAVAAGKIAIPHYQSFYQAGQNLLAALAGSDAEYDIQWMANVFYNLSLYDWLINKKLPNEGALDFLNNLPESIAPTFSDAITIVKAISYVDERPEDTIEIVGDEIATDADTHSIMLLLIAQAYNKLENHKSSLITLSKIKKMAEHTHGTHVAQAIVKYNLLNL